MPGYVLLILLHQYKLFVIVSISLYHWISLLYEDGVDIQAIFV